MSFVCLLDSISCADSSAMVKIGNTTVVCGLKLEIGVPGVATNSGRMGACWSLVVVSFCINL